MAWARDLFGEIHVVESHPRNRRASSLAVSAWPGLLLRSGVDKVTLLPGKQSSGEWGREMPFRWMSTVRPRSKMASFVTEEFNAWIVELTSKDWGESTSSNRRS
jgi:hypothetical protein